MTIFLSLMIVVFAVGAAVALTRGLMAFVRDGERIRQGEPNAVKEFGLTQNRMMFQRVLLQGVAILLVALIGLLAGRG